MKAAYIPQHVLKRVQRAVPDLDPRTVDAIAFHLKLERELTEALAHILPRPERIARLGFGHKISILQATTSDTWIDVVAEGLIAFDGLRHAAAHGNPKPEFDACLARVRVAVERLSDVPVPATATIGGLAMALSAALAVDVEARTAAPRANGG